MIDKVNRRVFPMLTRRQRWDCPACSVYKLSNSLQHIVARNETLCWGVWDKAKAKNAQRKGIGYLVIGYQDDVKMMIAGSHLYESQPALDIVHAAVEHTKTRRVTRLGWSDNWRPNPDGDPLRWEVIDAKTDNLSLVVSAIQRAGIADGHFGKKSVDEVKSVIEQILSGVTFNSSD